MAILRDGLARCPVKGCPVRYTGGDDQLCHDHGQPADTPGAMARMEAWRASIAAAPGELGGGRQHYAADILPTGAAYGDTMTLPPNPLDPGVGSLGVTDPAGSFNDPPRLGAPEDYAGPGNEPG